MTCPICQKDTDEKHRPFCSLRCADIDLGKWMTGAYATPLVAEDQQIELEDELDQLPPKTH